VTLVCTCCHCPILPGQLWLPKDTTHVACPTAGQIERAVRYGRWQQERG
jgi:hypothetical protein